MSARESEAFVLRTYPYREADLIVSFVSRDQGKLRGVARRARRPKNPFGSGLERLAHVRLFYFQRQNRDLVRLDRSELLEPPLFLRADYASGVALDYIAEVCDHLLPEQEPNDAFFRLVTLVLDQIRLGLEVSGGASRSSEPTAVEGSNGVGGSTGSSDAGTALSSGAGGEARLWAALTYFSLWAVRLGRLAAASRCLHPERGGVGFFGDGLFRTGSPGVVFSGFSRTERMGDFRGFEKHSESDVEDIAA